MNCPEALEAAVAHLSGELSDADARRLGEHLAGCEACRAEAGAIERAWGELDSAAGPRPSPAFAADTLAAMQEATIRRRVVPFRPRRSLPLLAQAAALFATGAAGFFLARSGRLLPASPAAQPPAAERRVSLAAERTIDVAQSTPDLTNLPKVTNVSYRPADASGRVAVSFDVNTRYTIVGRADEEALAGVLAKLVSDSSGTEGARSKAIELVSQHCSASSAPPSAEIVAALVSTLEKDPNPGVRKKAAEALVQMTPTPAIRDAFVRALAKDQNPAIRILAIEGLAKAASTLGDAATIETLREKATDSNETGYVRAKAAGALRQVRM